MRIDEALVSRLVAAQFPEWAHLPVRPVEADGWDNRTFRLGTDMSVRLPSAAAYAAQVAKEQRWLPVLAPQLPLPIPVPLAAGRPDEAYPWSWSVYRWLTGEPAETATVSDKVAFARTLGSFLAALGQIDASDGPPAGEHNFFRGGPLSVYDGETRQAVATLGDQIDATTVTEVWETALASRWHGAPVWVRGDVSATNLLVLDGRLDAVIDFGSSGVGDPACDTVIAWTFLAGESREAFRETLAVDEATWARGRAWALWKSLITLAPAPQDPALAARAQGTLDVVLADHALTR
jgi:aminoglycoside phosphotransferase (APT) family kinase protein